MVEKSYKQYRIASIDRSPWRSMLVFIQIAGKWWWSVWVVIVLAGIVTLALTITKVIALPPAIWGSLFALGIVFAPMVAFHFLRVERDIFNALWNDKSAIISILEEMEELRKEAAPLHIRGMKLKTTRAVNKWVKEVDNWTQRAVSTVNLLHPAEAGNLWTLGVFDVRLAIGTKTINAKHLSAIRNLVRRMDILSEIRNRWTSRTIS